MMWLLLLPAFADDFTYPTTAVIGPMSEAEADAALQAAEPVCAPGEYVVKYWVTAEGVELERDDSGGCLAEAVLRAEFTHHGGCSLVTQRVEFEGLPGGGVGTGDALRVADAPSDQSETPPPPDMMQTLRAEADRQVAEHMAAEGKK